MKSTHKSFIGRNRGNLASSIAMLLVGFASVPFQAHAQFANTKTGDFALASNTTGGYNTADGYYALYSNTSGFYNTADGVYALVGNTTGSFNTASGYQALASNTTGNNNTAYGVNTLNSNTTGTQNTANGIGALFRNTTGNSNTASGVSALSSNTTGLYNTASGAESLNANTIGVNNAATGYRALYSNTTGQANTAMGSLSLTFNSTGSNNTATGIDALYSNTSGHENTASGVNVLLSNTTGYFNTADGGYALYNNTIGNSNVALGVNAGYNLTTGSNNIVIGAGVLGAAGDANKIRIGKSAHTATLIGGIYGKSVSSNTTGGGVPVLIDSTGKLGTVKSSARFKEAIKPMDKASEAILSFQPVTFRYKQELDPDGVTQFGLIAEQVEKISSDLVIRDEDGKISTVRYEAVNAMLLNEFLKEHRKVQTLQTKAEEQDATITDLKSALARQEKQIKALNAGLQKVSGRIELKESLPRVAKNR